MSQTAKPQQHEARQGEVGIRAKQQGWSGQRCFRQGDSGLEISLTQIGSNSDLEIFNSNPSNAHLNVLFGSLSFDQPHVFVNVLPQLALGVCPLVTLCVIWGLGLKKYLSTFLLELLVVTHDCQWCDRKAAGSSQSLPVFVVEFLGILRTNLCL